MTYMFQHIWEETRVTKKVKDKIDFRSIVDPCDKRGRHEGLLESVCRVQRCQDLNLVQR